MGKHRRKGGYATLAAIALGGFIFAAAQSEVSRRYVAPLFDRAERGAGISDLIVSHDWPMGTGCDGATQVAMPRNGLLPEAVHFTAQDDVRKAVVSAGGGAWGIGHLNLYMTGRSDKVVHITRLEVVVFREHAEDPGWIVDVEGGCGAAYERVFEVRLDHRRRPVKDVGVVGEPAAARGTPPTSGLGPTFTVSSTNPAHVRVVAFACARSYDWGLKVSYLVDGRADSYTVGSPEKPLRSIGGYTPSWVKQADDSMQPAAPTRANCAYRKYKTGDTVEEFLHAFLGAWWFNDHKTMEQLATAGAIKAFNEDSTGWGAYAVHWDPLYCVIGSSGVGGCDISLVTAAGREIKYAVTYRDNRNGDLEIYNIEPRE